MVAVNGGIEWGFDAPSHLSASCTQPLAILAGQLLYILFIHLYICIQTIIKFTQLSGFHTSIARGVRLV